MGEREEIVIRSKGREREELKGKVGRGKRWNWDK